MIEHSHPERRLTTLTTVSHEFEASTIVAALEAEGIRAQAVGGLVAEFRVKLPNGVSVIVADTDYARARSILDDLRAHPADIDWSQIDVGPPEPDV